jgi:hypothetical protein
VHADAGADAAAASSARSNGPSGSATGGAAAPVTVAKNGERLGIATGSPFLPSGVTLPRYLQKIHDLGLTWVRTDASLHGYPDTQFLDATLDAARQAHLRVLVTLTYTWSANGGSHNEPKDHRAWASFAGDLVDHWNESFPGLIGAYEIWNEANADVFFHPPDASSGNSGAQAYFDLLKTTYSMLHPKVGSAPILTTGTAPADGDGPADAAAHPSRPASWVQALYDLNGDGSSGLFDAVAHHPYQTSGAVNKAASGYRATAFIRQVMNAHGDAAKQIWATEAGWPSCTATPNGSRMTEPERSARLDADLKDWFYGLHDPAGASTGRYAEHGDWNTALWVIYKLYKNYDNLASDPALGLIDGPSDHCDDGSTPKAWFEPEIVQKAVEFAGRAQSTVPP